MQSNPKEEEANLSFSKLLSRQVRKAYGKDFKWGDQFEEFLKLVDDTYAHYEEDRKLISRSLDLSSRELLEKNHLLSEQNTTHQSAIDQLRKTITHLGLSQQEQDDFNLQEADILSIVAFLRTTIKQKRTEEQSRVEHHQRLRIINSIDQMIMASNSLEEIIENSLRALSRFLKVQSLNLSFFDFEKEEFIAYGYNPNSNTQFFKNRAFPITILPDITGLLEHKLHHIENMASITHPSRAEKQLMSLGYHSYVMLPMIHQNKLSGFLGMASEEEHFFKNTNLMALASILTENLSSVLEQQKLKDELKRSHEILREKNERITESINYARDIQQANLPDLSQLHSYFPRSFVIYKPKYVVSGDFYWFTKMDNKIVVILADCTGHGIPGGFITIQGINYINDIIKVRKVLEPGVILTYLHVMLQQKIKSDVEIVDGIDLGVITIDRELGTIQYAGANRPLYHVSEGELTVYKPSKIFLGYESLEEYIDFNTVEVNFKRKDSIYFFSDGIVDQFGGGKREKFKTKRLTSLISDNQHLKMKQQGALFEKTIVDWMGNEDQLDDITMIGINL